MDNEQVKERVFLKGLSDDDFYPRDLVDKGARILRELCEAIEREKPGDLVDLYELTHAATERFNDLDEELARLGSEIETMAREIIAEDFAFIAAAYEFPDADIEELIAPRDW